MIQGPGVLTNVTRRPVLRRVASVFVDDDVHSTDEIREIIIGHSTNNRLLVVSFTERSQAIRLISARLATNKERKDYEENVYT